MTFEEELKILINKHDQENESNTPDFLLAEYITACLRAYDTAVCKRDKWYGMKMFPGSNPENKKAKK